MQSDQFEHGQWLKGRIYERRCDLSPSGKLFAYFAIKGKSQFGTWTAICKPPFFTALALWPKGDSWGGGALFKSENEIGLNHGSDATVLAEGFRLPKHMNVKPLHEYAGRGEDNPIYYMRLLRDGWQLTQQGHRAKASASVNTVYPCSYPYNPPLVYSKQFAFTPEHTYHLNMVMHGLHQKDGPWHVLTYNIQNEEGKEIASLGLIDWADWDKNGDLVFAREGKIFRLRRLESNPFIAPLDTAIELIDLAPLQFAEKAPEPWATRW
jgi:hypothetical protein